MIGIQMEPVDTLFFRDGTPFSAGSASQEDVGGLFPPHPASVVGALRAALARLNGWTGNGGWPQRLNETLGDGPDDLGKISLTGPFLLRDGQPLFPAPRHLLGSGEAGVWRPRTMLRPGSPVACDLGEVQRLPEMPPHDGGVELAELKAGDGWWLTRPGLEAVLRGEIPPSTEVVPSRDLWREERRIGLERNDATRTAQEGMLYSTRHVRPLRGIALGVRISGLPEGWTLPFGQVVALGGESRLAECREWQVDLAIDMPLAAIEVGRRLVVVALSPLDLEEAVYLGREPLTSLGNARVISACLSRPQRIGGWDSLTRRPLPVRSVLSAGSVLFCELTEPERLRAAVATSGGLPCIGERQRWGFGMVAPGTWSDESEVTS
jgi:CRISPR-associated protein Cmr3